MFFNIRCLVVTCGLSDCYGDFEGKFRPPPASSLTSLYYVYLSTRARTPTTQHLPLAMCGVWQKYPWSNNLTWFSLTLCISGVGSNLVRQRETPTLAL